MFHVKHPETDTPIRNAIDEQDRFVVDLLATLRKERFGPAGWLHFLGRSWEKSCSTAQAYPTLKRSWARLTLLIAILAMALLIASFLLEGPGNASRLLPGFLVCVVWQQSDLFWHLGLNRRIRTGKLLPTLGIANTVTWLRALGASFLIGRLIGGLGTSPVLALFIFLAGIVTDILDGKIARRTGMETRLGQIADGEVDFCFYSALAVILIQNGAIPLWLGVVMLLRFVIPFLGALANYFVFARPLRFGSTMWGKCAGVAQSLYVLVVLAPGQLSFITHLINFPLLIVTLILLIAAPIAQFAPFLPATSKRTLIC